MSVRTSTPASVRSVALRYGGAILIVFAATALRLIFLGTLGTRAPYITFYPAVTLAALLGGLGPGLLATSFSGLVASFFWIEPLGQFLSITDPGDLMSMCVFALSGLLVSGVCEALKRIRVRAHKAEMELRLAAEHQQVKAAEEKSAEMHRVFFESGAVGMAYVSPEGRLLKFNDKYCELTGYTQAELVGKAVLELTHPEEREKDREQFEAYLREERPVYSSEKRYLCKDGSVRWVSVSARMIHEADGRPRYSIGIIEDITERKQWEREREVTVEFLNLINACRGTKQLVEAAAHFFKVQSGCEALGIRLREGDDYPYYEARGFPEEFVRLENSLCVRCADGEPERDSEGNPVLACMCGNIICGRFDPSKPFFTPAGSFWANDTARLLATTTEADRQARTRNRCNGEGYESVALIALHLGEERLGLLQLNDRRKGMFSPQSIALWERMAGYLAVALAKSRADEALLQSEERYHTLFDALIEGFCIIEVIFDEDSKPIDYRFLATNEAFEAQTGLHDAEGKSMRELAPDHEAHWFEIYGRIALTGEPKHFVNEAKALNRWYDVNAYRIGGQDSRKVAILFNDITNRKRAEDSQALLRDVLQILNRGGELHALIADTLCLIRDATGFDAVGLRLRRGEDCPYFENNGFSGEFLREENFLCARGGDGAITRDAKGRAVLECTCGLVLSGQTDPSMSCFTEGGSFWTNVSTELLSLPREADPRTNPRNHCIHVGYQSVGLFPVRVGSEILGLLQLNDHRAGRFTPELLSFYETLAQNIGLAFQRMTAEESLKEADRKKDAFLAMLAHELRNPMAAISAAATLMSRPNVSPDKVEYAREALGQRVNQLGRLIDDLLDLSRITRGKIELRKENLDLEFVIARAVESSRSFFDDRKQQLVVRVLDPLPVFGDPVRLEQIIVNLLTNASRYSDEGQEITLTALREGSEAVMRVRDYGIGIAPSLMSNIFEPFTQAENSLERTRGGLGLGLSIVKNLCEMHRGSVSIASEGEGKGSEAEVRLPIGEAYTQKVFEEERIPSPGALRILLAEDHPDTATMTAAMLELEGHAVEIAVDGLSAVERALRMKPDVILLDIGLPGCSGYEVAEKLRRAGLTDTLIIAVTGYGQEQDILRARQAGIDDHLLKPVNYQKLIALISLYAGKKTGTTAFDA